MVDFKKHLGKSAKSSAPVDPVDLYETLDRASDKGPLRPAQKAVLTDWHDKHRAAKDVILKLHTGQGKTLIGLLILQSKLNEGKGPALYVAPNKFLAAQTCEQASQFGVRHVSMDKELPGDFLDSKAILVTHVQKLFNGKSKFGLGPSAEAIGSIVLDDSHACIEAIQSAFVVDVKRTHVVYQKLLDLFSFELEKQGLGTFHDIRKGDYGAFLAVPYWDWLDKVSEVASILSSHGDNSEVKFAWPLLKDILPHCQCVISGNSLEIAPYIPNLDQFESFVNAGHRVFMSATVADDSFFVKGLGLAAETIRSPLTYKDEKWSGEKMILIPGLIDESLDRGTIVQMFGPEDIKRSSGVVALVPSSGTSTDWEKYGALVASRNDIEQHVGALRSGAYTKTLVVVNRYDGIDLPDSACRILILDSRPRPESLLDRQMEACRPASEAMAAKVTRSIEQGLGRSVRGEKDYCAIILTGPDLVKHVRLKGTREQFSGQTRTQIDIGLTIATLAKTDIAVGDKPTKTLLKLVQQCIGRDEGWKEYYVASMDAMGHEPPKSDMLDIFVEELAAERAALAGQLDAAIAIAQKLADRFSSTPQEQGWYVQEKARYTYGVSKSNSNTIQVAAHKLNRNLLKPKSGMVVPKIKIVSHKRLENIIRWVSQFDDYGGLSVAVDAFASSLHYGVKAATFEQAVHDLGQSLGFECQRPDKEWNEGPDNLWAVSDAEYILIECKSEVATDRIEINKGECGQMNTSIAWFHQQYPGNQVHPLMMIPPSKCGSGVAFTEAIGVVRVSDLKKLVNKVRGFFGEFRDADLSSCSASVIQGWLDAHDLAVGDLSKNYCKRITE